MKHIFPIYDHQRVGKSTKFLSAIYKQNLHNEENWPVINDFVKLLTTCVQILIADYVFAVLSAFSGPAIIYFLDGERELIIPTCFPGTSLASMADYALNITYQAFVCIACGCIYLYFDMLILVLVLHVSLLTDILRKKMRRVMAAEKQLTHLEITMSFRNFINMQNELYE